MCLIPATKTFFIRANTFAYGLQLLMSISRKKNKHCRMLRENRKEEGKLVLFPAK